MKYYSIEFTDDMPDNFSGQAGAWFIKIRPRCAEDAGLLRHEIRHVAIWWIAGLVFTSVIAIVALLTGIPMTFCPLLLAGGFAVSPLLYKFCRSYRKWNEASCYREQLNWPPATVDRVHYSRCYAEFLADPARYALGISVEEALQSLE